MIWDVVAVHVSKQKVQKGGCFWCFFNWTSWRIPFRKMHMVIYVSITILDIKWEILTFEIVLHPILILFWKWSSFLGYWLAIKKDGCFISKRKPMSTCCDHIMLHILYPFILFYFCVLKLRYFYLFMVVQKYLYY